MNAEPGPDRHDGHNSHRPGPRATPDAPESRIDPGGPDDAVADAVRRWRDQPVPDGPSPAALGRAVDRTLAAAHAMSPNPAADPAPGPSRPLTVRGAKPLKTLLKRIGAMNRWTRLAAAALLAVAVAGGVVLLAGRKAVAFADVKKQIQEASTLSYTIRVEHGGKTTTAKVYLKMPGRMRQEVADPGQVTVFDADRQRSVSLIPAQKLAVVVDIAGAADLVRQKAEQTQKAAQPFKDLLDGQKQDLGRKDVDGRPADGYRLTRAGTTMDLWVDPKTGNPVRMELVGANITVTDFAINPPLDDALFSLDVPAGYQVVEQKMDLTGVTETDYAAGLEMLARLNRGMFPDEPVLTPALIQAAGKAKPPATAPAAGADPKPATPPDAAKFGQTYTRSLMFTTQLQQAGGELHYFGSGVTLGDRNRPIAAWRAKGAKGYRMLYGDLHVEDADEARLPATRPAGK